MANSNYKPLLSGSGGGSCIFVLTTSTEAPFPGDPNKIYLFKDRNTFAYWDNIKKIYIEVSTSTSGTELKYASRAAFPVPGIEDFIYLDQSTGKKYIWNDKSGSTWVRINNWRFISPEYLPSENTPFFTDPVIVKQTNIPQTLINIDGKKIAISPIWHEFLVRSPGGNTGPVQPPDNLGVIPPAYFINVAYDGMTSPRSLSPAECNSGMNTDSYMLRAGAYVQIN